LKVSLVTCETSRFSVEDFLVDATGLTPDLTLVEKQPSEVVSTSISCNHKLLWLKTTNSLVNSVYPWCSGEESPEDSSDDEPTRNRPPNDPVKLAKQKSAFNVFYNK
jgi:hypothetical protein